MPSINKYLACFTQDGGDRLLVRDGPIATRDILFNLESFLPHPPVLKTDYYFPLSRGLSKLGISTRLRQHK